MIGATHVVADRLRRLGANENCTCVAHAIDESFRIPGADFEMLRRNSVGEHGGLVPVSHDDNCSELPPAGCCNFAALQGFQSFLDCRGHRPAEVGIIRNQDGLSRGVMFSLRHQIKGKPVRMIVDIRNDQHFGRPRDHVYTDMPEHPALRRCDEGIAWSGDLVDGRKKIPYQRP